jgi:hypothetical protein
MQVIGPFAIHSAAAKRGLLPTKPESGISAQVRVHWLKNRFSWSPRAVFPALFLQFFTLPGYAQSTPIIPPQQRHELTSEGELGVGWLFLPTTEVCTSDGCVRPDTSFLFHLAARLHFHRRWAVGAGAHLALWPTAQPPSSTTQSAAERELSRAYTVITAEALYFPWRKRAKNPIPGAVDPFMGVDLGVALLTDRYQSPPSDPNGALRIGQPGTTIHTEGFIGRALIGADFGITRYLAVGLGVQGGALWFPPIETTSFGDSSTVSGAELVLSATLTVKAYLGL